MEFNLREAEADLAEAEERLKQAKATSLAKEEEDRYSLIKAESDLRLAELELRRNDLVAGIVAKQNTLAAEAARDRLNQLREDLSSRRATADASIAIQEAAVAKAKVKADAARRTIDAMSLRAPADGYVSIQASTNLQMITTGMQLPLFQIGDLVRAGMAVAEIPNLGEWQVTARIPERVTTVGASGGAAWNRSFECGLAIEDPPPDLRPGMTAEIEVVTAELKDVTWLPSQAVFDRDGQKFVYLSQANAFTPVDVTLVRAGESKIVITGLEEGDVVALSDPTQRAAETEAAPDASKALSGQ
jgi:multidrug efflux pump subunit AcrA (membrane-fusion protein)